MKPSIPIIKWCLLGHLWHNTVQPVYKDHQREKNGLCSQVVLFISVIHRTNKANYGTLLALQGHSKLFATKVRRDINRVKLGELLKLPPA